MRWLIDGRYLRRSLQKLGSHQPETRSVGGADRLGVALTGFAAVNTELRSAVA